MKQVEVQIMGQGYLLGCPEGGEAQLRDAVARVDEAMCKIRDSGKVKARDRIAVLAALNLAFDVPAAVPVAAPAANTTPIAKVDTSAWPEDRLSALIARLDKALEADGQLI
jgi:cell division protein ZapA